LSDAAQRDELTKLGVKEVLAKPSDNEAILRVLQRCLAAP